MTDPRRDDPPPTARRPERVDLDAVQDHCDDAQPAHYGHAIVQEALLDDVDAMVVELQAGRDLADDIRQYEGHGLTALDAALDTYRKKLQGREP